VERPLRDDAQGLTAVAAEEGPTDAEAAQREVRPAEGEGDGSQGCGNAPTPQQCRGWREEGGRRVEGGGGGGRGRGRGETGAEKLGGFWPSSSAGSF